MAQVIPQRMSAQIEGDFVVFLIGVRINRPWQVHKWLPVVRAMGRMLRELHARPDSGFLGHTDLGLGIMVQYWRSFDALEAYARADDQAHWPAWRAFNKVFNSSRGDIGIWHETYAVPAGRYETVYSGMPPHGLGKAATLVPATGARERARDRIGAAA